jgi:tetratricopeptide (TPR) repeat protein
MLTLALLLQGQEISRYQNPGTALDPRSQITSPSRYFNSITGSVRGTDNRPLVNVRVELHDSVGAVVNSAWTGNGGEFEFRQVAAGSYRVVAVSGLDLAEERVEVHSWSVPVNLHLPTRRAPNDDARNTVSVAHYKVPERAREELRKAREATLKGKVEEAQAHVAKALEIDPDYADALTLRAVLKLSAHDSDGAVKDLNRAIQCDGSYAMAYLVLGSAFNAQAKYDDALRALQHGATLSPDAWQAHFEMGKAYLGKTEYQSALHELDRAQTLAPPDYSLIRLIRAHVLMQLNRHSDAVADLQLFLDKNPEGPDAELAQKMIEQAKASLAAQK